MTVFCRLSTNCHFYPRSPCGERHVILDTQIKIVIISIHALLAESDAINPVTGLFWQKFLSTLSLRRATRDTLYCTVTEERFLSTLSLRRATSCGSTWSSPAQNFYPRSPCGERPLVTTHGAKHVRISIHALLAESDLTMLTAAI